MDEAGHAWIAVRIPLRAKQGERRRVIPANRRHQAADAAPLGLGPRGSKQLAAEPTAPVGRGHHHRYLGCPVGTEIEPKEPDKRRSIGRHPAHNPRIGAKTPPPPVVGDSRRNSKTLGFEPRCKDLQVLHRERS